MERQRLLGVKLKQRAESWQAARRQGSLRPVTGSVPEVAQCSQLWRRWDRIDEWMSNKSEGSRSGLAKQAKFKYSNNKISEGG